MQKNKILKKGAFLTDIHFGKKGNSEEHNQDCLNHLKWFCDNVRADPDIDYIGFLGDWNESRSALNVRTLHYSYMGAKMLNELNLPVYFVVGNHDLYHRHTREIHSVIPFNEFSNFIVIDHPTVIKEIKDHALFCPFMFHHEYPDLVKHLDLPFWAGHFEFKGFYITGYNIKMPAGPDPKDFKGPKYITSGHFHKRQATENIVYMGNTFPMDFNDANDYDRGMMTYDHVKEEMLFFNWDDCPKYIKSTLTELLEGKVTLYPHARVNCTVDVEITYEENNYIRETYKKKHNLRELKLIESSSLREALKETKTEDIDWENIKLASVDELVAQMLNDIKSDDIDNEVLLEIYKSLIG